MTQTVVLIAARARNGTIGRDGALPWRLPADLKHFKTLTMGQDGSGRPMIMGRRTFESFPAPLPGRRHIVLTRDAGWRADGAEVAHDPDAALALAGDGEVMVIGGAQVYALLADRADRFELTEVHADVPGDTTMPAPGPDWHETSRDEHPADGDRPAFAFVTLARLYLPPAGGAGGGPRQSTAYRQPTPQPPPASGRGRMTRTRKLLAAITGLLVLAAVVFFGPLPAIVEGRMNRIDGQPLIPISDHARKLHATLTIVDLHADTLLWRRSVLTRANRGHVDLPRLEVGNVTLQVFSSVTKTPRGLNYDRNTPDTDNVTLLAIAQLQPVRTWHSLTERSLWHAAKLDRAVADSGGELRKIASAQNLERLVVDRQSGRPVGAMLSIEGLHDLEGRADNLDRLHAAGFRMASLTHFFDDELADSMHGLAKGGVTPFGRQVVRRMEDIGMIVDVAHCSHACVADLIAMARRPLVSSHGGVQATCKVNRNLTDDEIRGVARTGGVIGIGYWDGAACSTSPRNTAKAMRHVRDLVGIQHVALGSDFDGSTTTRFDTSQLVQITQALTDEGFSDDEIRAVMGLNALRVIREGIQPLLSE